MVSLTGTLRISSRLAGLTLWGGAALRAPAGSRTAHIRGSRTAVDACFPAGISLPGGLNTAIDLCCSLASGMAAGNRRVDARAPFTQSGLDRKKREALQGVALKSDVEHADPDRRRVSCAYRPEGSIRWNYS